MIIMS